VPKTFREVSAERQELNDRHASEVETGRERPGLLSGFFGTLLAVKANDVRRPHRPLESSFALCGDRGTLS